MTKIVGTTVTAWSDDQKDQLYLEWMTLKNTERTTSRRVIGLWDVFGKVGGIGHVFTAAAALFFTQYA